MGKNWTYAHNGQLKGYQSLETGRFRAIGQTDSEKSFLLDLKSARESL